MTLNFCSKTTTSLVRAALATMAGILLASCGGGTTQVEPFVPSRYIAFGDELSAFEPDGRKYTLNAFNAAATAYDCSLNPLWIQTVASIYGFQFAECPVGSTDAKAITRAAANARAAELKLQIDAQEQQGFTARDLVTVLVGTNDVKDIYETRGNSTEDELITLARERGVAIATQVNRLVNLGAKVIISTTPDVGLTPYAVAKGAADAALLSRLSAAMNGRIRVNILNDGRFVGLVLADELVQTAVRFPSAYGLADGAGVTTGACSVALPNCDNTTLIAGANVDGWLWADELRLGLVAHRQLGSLAAGRAQNNPF